MSAQGDRLETLIDAVIDGTCNEEGLRRLESLMRDPQARSDYVDQMGMHALLQWHHGQIGAGPRFEPGPGSSVPVPIRRGTLLRSVAAVALVALGAMALSSRAVRRGGGMIGPRADAPIGAKADENIKVPAARAVAALVEARDVAWGEGQTPLPLNGRIFPGSLRLGSGRVKLAFDSGALVTLEGPAEVRILSEMRIQVARGRAMARAEGTAKGFTIETPNTLVVDQGTEFGVEIDRSGRTGVVVFEGRVDLARPGSDGASPSIQRLEQGEAMRVGRSGKLSRIVAVERRQGDSSWSTGTSADREAVIRSVRDNIRGLDSTKYYRIVHRGLDDDAPAYVDRNHQWNGLTPDGLPAELKGADYIMPFNEDKWMKQLQVTVEMARPATLFVIFDNREEIPPWLSEHFTDTGYDIGLDEVSKAGGPLLAGRGPGESIDNQFSVWKREVERNELVVLGALRKEDEAKAMYGIAAQPRP